MLDNFRLAFLAARELVLTAASMAWGRIRRAVKRRIRDTRALKVRAPIDWRARRHSGGG